MADIWFPDCDGLKSMTTRFAKVNGVNIGYCVQGEGPPLVLVMGYRLSSAAWPAAFVDALARRFTVITMDNRGTGQSDKPVDGYAIANMARDLGGLLNELNISHSYILGYSMGGAIAQEFARQFPARVSGLVLCATMCGGPRAIYAPPPVVRVMRELDGLEPDEIARQIWKVTYSPGYLEKHRELAEDQMRREIVAPTPLHAADLQFQAFAEFDCSKALPNIHAPTLVLTGELDQLISPRNSRMIAGLIPGAKLVIIPGCGHRVMWEATDECVAFVAEFLIKVEEGRLDTVTVPLATGGQNPLLGFVDFLTPAVELFTHWPWMLAGAGVDTMTIARQSIYFGGKAQFGDGKPIILFSQPGSNLPFVLLSNWLRVLGYRPVTTSTSRNSDQSIANVTRATAQRMGRKAVIVASASGMHLGSELADIRKDWVSDIVVLNASPRSDVPLGVRSHFISSSWSLLFAMTALPQVLRDIQIELIGASGSIGLASGDSGAPHAKRQLPEEGDRK
jgi:pimeloyl-ACP methyl ester carboxylesterase